MKKHNDSQITDHEPISLREVLDYITEPGRRKKLIGVAGLMLFIVAMGLLSYFGTPDYTMPKLASDVMFYGIILFLVGMFVYVYIKQKHSAQSDIHDK